MEYEKKTSHHLQKGIIGITICFLISCTQTDIPSSQTNNPNETVLPSTTETQKKTNLDQSAITTVHNNWRSKVGAPKLKWSEELANTAQSWANTLKNNNCGFYHSHNGYGENLYKASPTLWSDGRREIQTKTPKDVTDSWGNEVKHYDYNKNRCSGGVCGHYTQVVWKETKKVGCAMSICNDNSQIWVCSYYPAGNVEGKKPY